MAIRVMFYQEIIEKELAEIKADFEFGAIVLTPQEYNSLIESYQSMLDEQNENFFYFAKNLTKYEHEMMLNRMSKPLLMQYKKPNTDKILILALQMKQDFADVKDDFLNASTKILKS
jgi:hypothetical protein